MDLRARRRRGRVCGKAHQRRRCRGHTKVLVMNRVVSPVGLNYRIWAAALRCRRCRAQALYTLGHRCAHSAIRARSRSPRSTTCHEAVDQLVGSIVETSPGASQVGDELRRIAPLLAPSPRSLCACVRRAPQQVRPQPLPLNPKSARPPRAPTNPSVDLSSWGDPGRGCPWRGLVLGAGPRPAHR